MNSTQQRIIHLVGKKKKMNLTALALELGVTKQYISKIIKPLLEAGMIEKVGQTKGAYLQVVSQSDLSYGLGAYDRVFQRSKLQEDAAWGELVRTPLFSGVTHQVMDKVQYAFTEMLNNAIDHSRSETVHVLLARHTHAIVFSIVDNGIGVFRSIQKKLKFSSEQEAIENLLKGKMTTAPQQHTGEGIFFTSKIVDRFQIDSFTHSLIVREDIFLETIPVFTGTRVSCRVLFNSNKRIEDIFRKFTNEDFGFDKTEIHVKLYTLKTKFISRSEAKRLLHGLEKFERIVLDFQDVTLIGQGFADEIFRVWQSAHPSIEIQYIRTVPAVEFMIKRSISR